MILHIIWTDKRLFYRRAFNLPSNKNKAFIIIIIIIHYITTHNILTHIKFSTCKKLKAKNFLNSVPNYFKRLKFLYIIWTEEIM